MVEALTMRKQRNSLGFFSIRSDTQGQWRLLLKDKLDMGVTEYILCPRGGVTSGPAKCSLASLQVRDCQRVSSTNDRAKSDDDAAAPPSFAAIKKPQDVE
ncbi:hypothetical protein VNO77_22508 [Canavalia gladiata]|uniref:Uncharacterized protein n=1 Tax=Canavalia gladiata TaxID=3824 RepID=A0AAN9L7Y2_CANGL